MAATETLLAIFPDLEPAAQGIDKLHQLGINDWDMNVISGIPVKPEILARPHAITRVSTIGLVGAILGFLLGVFLVWGTPFLFPLQVGGQPVYPWPQLFIIVFEMTMLGLMGFSFLGLFVDSGFPSYTPKEYIPEISAGRIGVLFSIPREDEARFVEALKEAGAASVSPAEARQL